VLFTAGRHIAVLLGNPVRFRKEAFKHIFHVSIQQIFAVVEFIAAIVAFAGFQVSIQVDQGVLGFLPAMDTVADTGVFCYFHITYLLSDRRLTVRVYLSALWIDLKNSIGFWSSEKDDLSVKRTGALGDNSRNWYSCLPASPALIV